MSIIQCSCPADLGETSVPPSDLAAGGTPAPEQNCTAEHIRGQKKGGRKKKKHEGVNQTFSCPSELTSWIPEACDLIKIVGTMHSNRSYKHAEGNEGNYIFPRTRNWRAEDWKFPLPLLRVAQRGRVFPHKLDSAVTSCCTPRHIPYDCDLWLFHPWLQKGVTLSS